MTDERIRALERSVQDGADAATRLALARALGRIEPAEGRTVWSVRPPGRAGTENVPVAFGPRGLALASWLTRLHGVDVTDGATRWTVDAGGTLTSTPAIEGDAIFLANIRGE